MEEAFNRRYRWPESLKGFSASFTYHNDDRTVQGTVKADVTKPHGGVEVACDDEDVKKLVQSTVGSTVTHSRASQFEKAFRRVYLRDRGEQGAGAAPRSSSPATASSTTSPSKTATSSRTTAATVICPAR